MIKPQLSGSDWTALPMKNNKIVIIDDYDKESKVATIHGTCGGDLEDTARLIQQSRDLLFAACRLLSSCKDRNSFAFEEDFDLLKSITEYIKTGELNE